MRVGNGEAANATRGRRRKTSSAFGEGDASKKAMRSV